MHLCVSMCLGEEVTRGSTPCVYIYLYICMYTPSCQHAYLVQGWRRACVCCLLHLLPRHSPCCRALQQRAWWQLGQCALLLAAHTGGTPSHPWAPLAG